jgi:hypothetical protein
MPDPKCPKCDAPARIEDRDGGREWWCCWNGHTFVLGGEPDPLDEILADPNPWPRRIGSTPL